MYSYMNTPTRGFGGIEGEEARSWTHAAIPPDIEGSEQERVQCCLPVDVLVEVAGPYAARLCDEDYQLGSKVPIPFVTIPAITIII